MHQFLRARMAEGWRDHKYNVGNRVKNYRLVSFIRHASGIQLEWWYFQKTRSKLYAKKG